jgi:hypothetical protein
MKAIGKRALALLASSLFGTTLWLAIFIAIIVGFEHLPGQQDVGVIDRALVEAANYPGPPPISVLINWAGFLCELCGPWRPSR